MGCGYEYASMGLLCSEGFDVDEGDNGEAAGDDRFAEEMQVDCPYGDSVLGFSLLSDECVDLLISKESDHLPKDDYARRLQTGAVELSVRAESIDWMWKIHAHYNFGPLSAYLCVNFLDRFLSYYDLPQGKAWMTQLLSVACLSLAAKMEETEVPLSLDLQGTHSKYIFEARTIQRMELLILSILGWRMHAVTPFSFLSYFLEKFSEGRSVSAITQSRSVELVLNTIKRIDFLGFRPSEIAASVALSVSGTNKPLDINRVLSNCIKVNKERVLNCYEMTTDIILLNAPFKFNGGSVSSVPRSPNGVLDATSLSYKSEDTAVGSQANSQNTIPDAKRRKINFLSNK